MFVRLEQNLVDEFNPSLQKLVSLGNSYIQAFRGETVRGRRRGGGPRVLVAFRRFSSVKGTRAAARPLRLDPKSTGFGNIVTLLQYNLRCWPVAEASPALSDNTDKEL